MDIFLMQHGFAASEAEDPARPLTTAGRAAVARVAARARSGGVRAGLCVHSGALRAEQSATLLGAALEARVIPLAGLAPGDPPRPIADWLARQAGNDPDGAVAIVGHLPFLDGLATYLVTGREGTQVVRWRNAVLVKLTPAAPGRYAVEWALPPEFA